MKKFCETSNEIIAWELIFWVTHTTKWPHWNAHPLRLHHFKCGVLKCVLRLTFIYCARFSNFRVSEHYSNALYHTCTLIQHHTSLSCCLLQCTCLPFACPCIKTWIIFQIVNTTKVHCRTTAFESSPKRIAMVRVTTTLTTKQLNQ